MSKLKKTRKRLLEKEALFYIKEVANKVGKGKYFPTNMVKDKAFRDYNVNHCWKTYMRMLEKLESKGYVESVDTKVGKMWRLK